MQNATLWRALLGVEQTVVEDIEFDEDAQVLVAHVRPARRAASRCGRCRRRSPRYDHGEGRRRWRALDLGTVQVHLEADAARVNCREHGPTVWAVPWARHAAGHTTVFDEQVAWLATQCSKTAVTELMRIAWRTVGAIITRVWADVEELHDRFGGLRRIGIDEISYKRGHRYLTVVVDHDSGRLVWAAPGRDKATLELFFDALGEERCQLITHVSADGADWISTVVADRCVNAVRCADPFYADVIVMPMSWTPGRSCGVGRGREVGIIRRRAESGLSITGEEQGHAQCFGSDAGSVQRSVGAVRGGTGGRVGAGLHDDVSDDADAIGGAPVTVAGSRGYRSG